MQRFFRILIWDALYCLIPTVGYAAISILPSGNATYLVTILVFAVCGVFLSQLSRWGAAWMELVFIALPACYIALAPFLAPMLNSFPLPFTPVPAILLASKTEFLRTCCALTAGFVLWQRVNIPVRRR